MPLPLITTLSALGEMALPLGLLGVGGALMTVDRKMVGKAAWLAALIKTVVSPMFGWAVGRAMDLDPVALKMVMIFMATPTAVVSYAVALELKGDEKVASGAIVLSVITSVVTLSLVIALF